MGLEPAGRAMRSTPTAGRARGWAPYGFLGASMPLSRALASVLAVYHQFSTAIELPMLDGGRMAGHGAYDELVAQVLSPSRPNAGGRIPRVDESMGAQRSPRTGDLKGTRC